MHSSPGPSHFNGKHRAGGPPRINRNRMNLNSIPNTGQKHYNDQGMLMARPMAGHIHIIDEAGNADASPSSGSRKRDRDIDRSQEQGPSSGAQRDGKNGQQRGSGSEPSSKRRKIEIEEDEIEEVPDSTCNSPELDTAPLPSSAATLSMRMSPNRPERGPTLIFTRALRDSMPSGDQTQKSKELMKQLKEAREAASRLQSELRVMREERVALDKRVAQLVGEQNARRQLPAAQASESRIRSLTAELEAMKTSLRVFKQKLREADERATTSETSGQQMRVRLKALQAANPPVSGATPKTDQRIATLMQEKGSLIAQLEALRRESKGKGQESSIDAFSHRLDQVSEASIKSGVESLNDALDDLVMNILEKGDQLAQKHAHLVRPFSERDWYDDPNPLLIALGRSDLTDDNRGLLLDVRLHDQLHAELYDLFFSGDAISSRIDTGGLIQAIWDALIQKESWTVAQRWRALTASTVSTLVDESGFAESIANNAQEIIQVLVYVHGLTSTEFEDISEILFSGLEALYKEAKELAIRVRRDILSVRMTVTSVLETRFDPSRASSVWPEMGAVAGDDIVGRYRFGLMKLTEHGERSYLVRPEVATTALIRETAKNN